MYDRKQMTYTKREYDKLRMDLAQNKFLIEHGTAALIKLHKDALEKTLQAWDSLETGDYNPKVIEKWLLDKMKPAMIIARKALNPKETPNKQKNEGLPYSEGATDFLTKGFSG